MRIAMLAEDPRIVGGIPRYAVPLGEALTRRGAEVHYLWAGGFSGRYDLHFKRRWQSSRANGLTYHGLINPGSFGMNFGQPELDVASPDSKYIRRRIEGIAPDVIHIHSFLGFPTELLEHLASIAPVFISVHEFGLICQRRVLVQRGGAQCRTFATQTDCWTCVGTTRPGWGPWARMKFRLRHRQWARRIKVVVDPLIRLRLWPAIRFIGGQASAGDSPSFEIDATRESLTARYAARLDASLAAVNRHASRVLAVSSNVRDIMLEAGVDEHLVDVLHIGSASASRLSPTPLPCANGADPVLLFLGGLVPGKGAHVLVDAVASLRRPPRVIIAGHLLDSEYGRQLQGKATDTVEFFGPYSPADLPNLLACADVVVAPATGPDTSPQTVLEALAAGRPVIGSRIGGIPDFVHDGVNGLLFDAGDASALRAILEHLDANYVMRLANHIQPPKALGGHADELLSMYRNALP